MILVYKFENFCYNYISMKALIIKKPWIEYILNGQKTWEIRGCNTKIRGRIELIESGSGKIIGSCEIYDSKQLSLQDYQSNTSKHKIKDTKSLPYTKTYAWLIRDAERYKEPKPYKHPQGAIIWVNLNN